jgi:3D (Asp-Asp-Asp) domain-containing protein
MIKIYYILILFLFLLSCHIKPIESSTGTLYLPLHLIDSVTVTHYTNSIEETDAYPDIMASCNRVYDGALAISKDLGNLLKFGDKVYVENIGIFTVEDLMNRKWTKRVDIFTFSKKKARAGGIFKTRLFLIKEIASGPTQR